MSYQRVFRCEQSLLRLALQPKRWIPACRSPPRVPRQRELAVATPRRATGLASPAPDLAPRQKGWVPPPRAHRCLRKNFSSPSPRRPTQDGHQPPPDASHRHTLQPRAAGLPSARRGEADNHGPRKDPPASAEPRKTPGPLSNASAPVTSHAARPTISNCTRSVF